MTFIVIEGGEGVGKSTQVALLVERLRAAGHAVDQTREPGGTEAGAELRRPPLHRAEGDAPAPPQRVLEGRRIPVAQRIKPGPDPQQNRVSERVTPPTLAYPGAGR